MAIDILIRDAEENDAQAVANLLTELGYPSTPNFAARKIQQLAQSPADRVLVAIIDGTVGGVISLHITPCLHEESNLARVTALIVHEDYRGHGIGRKLMQTAEAIALAKGCRRVEITSSDSRCEAHAFYRRLRYEEQSRRFLKYIG